MVRSKGVIDWRPRSQRAHREFGYTSLGTLKTKAVEKSRRRIDDPRNISWSKSWQDWIRDRRASWDAAANLKAESGRSKPSSFVSVLPLRPPSGISKRISRGDCHGRTGARGWRDWPLAASLYKELNDRTDPNRPKSLRRKRPSACWSPVCTVSPSDPGRYPSKGSCPRPRQFTLFTGRPRTDIERSSMIV